MFSGYKLTAFILKCLVYQQTLGVLGLSKNLYFFGQYVDIKNILKVHKWQLAKGVSLLYTVAKKASVPYLA